MSGETGSEKRSGIGARLRSGRERMGLTLLQAAEKLHVDPKVVESLEAERFDALGAAVFVRGHLKHYAELIGEQGPQLLELYAGTTPPVQPDLTRIPKATPVSDPSRLAVPALIVLIGFAVVGIVWWVLQGMGAPVPPGSPAAARPVPIEPQLEAPLSEPPPVDTPAAGPAVTASATQPAQSAGANANGNAGARAASPPIASSDTPAQPAAASPMDLVLRFSADSWVEVYDASGRRLFYDIGSADSSRKLTGTPPLRVLLGNAAGVSLDVNGTSAPVPDSVMRNDDTAQFFINRSGRIVRARPGDGG